MFVDRAIRARLEVAAPGRQEFCYVYYYLKVYQEQTDPQTIIGAFESCPSGLTFNRKEPTGGDIQFLYTQLSFYLCFYWEFRNKSKKSVFFIHQRQFQDGQAGPS